MPLFMSQFSYTPDAWAMLLQQPMDRATAVQQLIEGLKGRLVGFYYSLGEHDALSIYELPSEEAAATFVGAAIAAGHIKESQTTLLLRVAGFVSAPRTEPRAGHGHYMVQATYTVSAWSAMVHHPQNRLEAVRPVAANLGGRLIDGWLTFGKYDVLTLLEMPDTLAIAAYVRALASGGAIKALKTTPLMTPEEGLEVMRRAAASGYQPPVD